jgi:DNA invertase Pin-like site-specific DNA recombinase
VEPTPEQAASAVERLDCPTCGAPAGSPCRTGGGNVAHRYHTPRFVLVPELRDAPEVMVVEDRGPGRPWTAAPPVTASVRIGYAYRATASPDIRVQLDALEAAGCGRIFTEQVDVRVKARPELDAALGLAGEIRRSTPGRPVVLTVHQLSRLARNAAELMTLSASLDAADIGLELLAGPLAGVHAPGDGDSMLFAVLAAAAELDRTYLRDKIVEAQHEAASRGNRGGRPRVVDDDMLSRARELRDSGVSVPDIAARLIISNGRNAGSHPSVASVYRALAEPATTPEPCPIAP